MEPFSEDWIRTINDVLAERKYTTGTVQEFEVSAKVVVSDVKRGSDKTFGIHVRSGRLSFELDPQREDGTISITAEEWPTPFPWNNQGPWIESVLSSGSLHIHGNVPRLTYFAEGLVRRLDSATAKELARRLGG